MMGIQTTGILQQVVEILIGALQVREHILVVHGGLLLRQGHMVQHVNKQQWQALHFQCVLIHGQGVALIFQQSLQAQHHPIHINTVQLVRVALGVSYGM
jgi:hypothetical protein